MAHVCLQSDEAECHVLKLSAVCLELSSKGWVLPLYAPLLSVLAIKIRQNKHHITVYKTPSVFACRASLHSQLINLPSSLLLHFCRWQGSCRPY